MIVIIVVKLKKIIGEVMLRDKKIIKIREEEVLRVVHMVQYIDTNTVVSEIPSEIPSDIPHLSLLLLTWRLQRLAGDLPHDMVLEFGPPLLPEEVLPDIVL